MIPTGYRNDYNAMQQELAAAEYEYLSGSQPKLDLTRIYSRYSDLWRLSTIEELKAARANSFERDRVDRLWSTAHEMRIRYTMRELDAALEQTELTQLRARMASEAMKDRRSRLYRAYIDLIASRNDLRQERLEQLRELAQKAGYSSPLELYREVRRVDYTALDAQMQQFLAHTERIYTIAQKARLRRLHADAHRSDSLYFLAITEFDLLYSPDKLLPAWRETMSEMGIRTYAQRELEVGRRVRRDIGTFAVGLSIPERVYLGIHPELGGLRGYEQFFHTSAKAELMAYTSPQLQMEFKYAGDKALEEGYGLLLASIVTDPAWLERTGNARHPGELTHLVALVRLARLRYWATLLHYELSLYTTGGDSDAYAEAMSTATGFTFEGVEHLVQPALESAYRLQGAIFEALLRDYMMTRYGRAWWTNTRAGSFLKELWNNGYRYSATELAAQIGLGSFVPDPLEIDLLFRLKV